MAVRWDLLATWMGSLATVAAVGVAYCGIEDAARQLAGKTIYDIAKDGKALQRRFGKGEIDADEVMSYFFSVYQLRRAKVLNKAQWAPIQVALCEFSRSGSNVKQSWDRYKGFYDSEFRALVDKLKGATTCE